MVSGMWYMVWIREGSLVNVCNIDLVLYLTGAGGGWLSKSLLLSLTLSYHFLGPYLMFS